MSESKIYTIPDGHSSIDPALMMALSQNGGFGNNGGWIDDKDGYDGIVFNRWYADTVTSGIPIEWDEML